MHKNLFAIAALVLASGYLVQSIRTASAQSFGPVFTGGDQPWVDFTGSVPACDYADLYTVPSDRVLVLTGAIGSSNYVDLYTDSSVLVHGENGVMTNTNSHLMTGKAHIPVAPGSTLRVYGRHCSHAGYRFAVQGYLTHL